MAVFKGGGIFSKYIFVVFRCSVLLLAANYHCGTEAILMWTAPPPAWNQTNPGTSLADIQTVVYQVRNGSTNVILRWNYTLLPSQTLLLTTFSIGDGISQDDIGLVIGGPVGTPNTRYKDLYSIYSTSQFSNLTINKVTVQENATFQCKLQVGTDVWAYNMRVEVTDPAVITQISGNQTVNETDVVALICSVEGMPTPIPSWTRVSDNSSVFFPLTITGKQHEGGYRCTADNDIGNPTSQVVYIIVENYHPIDTSLSTSLRDKSVVVVNTSFNITCSSEANPPAKYRFYKNQDNFVNVTSGNDVSVITTLVSERIKQVTYSCTPFNDFGDGLTKRLTLTVLFPPAISHAVPGYQVIEGSGAILFCNATGNPQPNITWTKQGNNSKLSTSETLNLTKLMREDDGSVYKCTVINEVGSAEATTIITVFFPPKAIIHKCPTKVTEESVVTFNCSTTGNPSPKVAWKRSGSVVVEDGAYVISAINRSQRGIYECMAWNGIGNNSTADCTVDVQYLPTSINITTLPSNNTILSGEALSLKCMADANPDAHIYHFFLNDNFVGNSSSGVFNTTVMADGVYTCVPENTVGTGDNATVSITAVVAPHAELTAQNDAVIEGGNVTLTCVVSGDPSPSILLTKLGSSSTKVLSNTSSLTIVNVSRPGTPDNMIQYQCTASNGVGTPATDITNVTVYYAPDTTNLTTVPSNRTLLRNSTMFLNCETNASPEAEYHFYFNGNLIGISSSGVFNTTVMADGVYTCVPNNTVGTGENATVYVTAVAAPSVEISNETAIVVEGEGLVLTCDASGEPKPSVTWKKVGSSEVLSNTSSLTIVNISRPGAPDNMIQYRCTASNGVGTPATATSKIDVYYTASVSNPGNESFNVEPGTEVNFLCLGMGNPTPTVNWTSADGVINWMSNLNNVTFTAEVYSSGSFLCTIKNDFGEAFKHFYLAVVTMNPLIKVTGTNGGRDDDFLKICKQIAEIVNGQIKGENELGRHFKTSEVENCESKEPGSVTVYLFLDFTQNVKITDVLQVLKNAAEGGDFGGFQVEPGSIQAISDEQLPTDPPSSTVRTTTSEDDKDNGMLWIIIGASVGGAIVLIIVVVVVAWCVHHKRKCRRKGSKVRCSESEAFAPEEGNDYGHANNGYADAGPRPTAMEDMSQHQGASAVPTYAVVDKSAKKASKKDKKVEEKKPQAAPPEYAAVDKSKKKKKEEPEATYAEVDKSKKSKKKPKPGEVLYADLGDFHQMQELPVVSTSPQALPPIKKPTPYGETQYADITQFLKGDATLPESNNSHGPGTGTQASAVPENSNSQEPGASTKETSQISNPGGDGGPGHETNF